MGRAKECKHGDSIGRCVKCGDDPARYNEAYARGNHAEGEVLVEDALRARVTWPSPLSLKESDRTRDLRRQLEESMAKDRADVWKSDRPLALVEFLSKWKPRLKVHEDPIPGTNQASLVLNEEETAALRAGFEHDLVEMIVMRIHQANLGHYKGDFDTIRKDLLR